MRIKCNGLSGKDVARAIKELKAYRAKLDTMLNLLIETLTVKGIDLAKANLNIYDIPYATGELESSIHGVFNAETGQGFIIVDSEHGKFFEFGTGVVGKNAPHPQAGNNGYQYDVNNHGDGGWWYFDTNNFHWTKGMPSRPFMWNTARQLRELVFSTAQQLMKQRH